MFCKTTRSKECTHLKFSGGTKASVTEIWSSCKNQHDFSQIIFSKNKKNNSLKRFLNKKTWSNGYIIKSDIDNFYASMRHDIIETQITAITNDPLFAQLIKKY